MKERNTTKTWKAKSRMVMCGSFAIDTEGLCNTIPTQHADVELLRMILSLTNGRLETLTIIEMNPVLQNMPIDESKD
eukprot:12901898-Prorocentrum_lima.AAC.1